MKVTRIDVHILGERGFPLVLAKLTEAQSADFATLLATAQTKNPASTPEDVIRAIWRYGVRQTNKNFRDGIPLKVEDLPGALKS